MQPSLSSGCPPIAPSSFIWRFICLIQLPSSRIHTRARLSVGLSVFLPASVYRMIGGGWAFKRFIRTWRLCDIYASPKVIETTQAGRERKRNLRRRQEIETFSSLYTSRNYNRTATVVTASVVAAVITTTSISTTLTNTYWADAIGFVYGSSTC